ncbi:MAG: IS701 family transposase [Nitrospira sp.]
MTPEQMMALGTAFAAYLRLFADCFGQARTAEHLHSYCRGLLSDLPRKSMEPIALACGTAVRTLQEFLRDHVWDHFRMRDQFQKRLALTPPSKAIDEDELGTIGVIDETSVAKKGTKTPGVRRQWCGALGKLDNCIVTVHLGIVRDRFKTLVDGDLFLPKVWSEDRERCRKAAIPDDVVYRPKWRIALEQLDRAAANGLTLNWLTFDEYYGSKPGFLENLDARPGMYYVGEIPRNFRCLAVRPRGKRPKGGWKGKRADNLARFSSAWNQRDWKGVSLSRLTLDNQEWEVRAGQVYLVRRGEVLDRTHWLIVARNVATGEVKYFISNAPADTPVEKLLRVAFCRWNVEHAFRVAKTEIGFGHFEGRSYVALMRHMIMCLVVMGFVAEHTDRLRGEKSGDNDGTGLPSVERTLPDMAEESPGDDAISVHGRGHRLSPAA